MYVNVGLRPAKMCVRHSKGAPDERCRRAADEGDGGEDCI